MKSLRIDKIFDVIMFYSAVNFICSMHVYVLNSVQYYVTYAVRSVHCVLCIKRCNLRKQGGNGMETGTKLSHWVGTGTN